MKSYILLVAVVALFAMVHFGSAASLERKLKDGSSFQRKLKACNMLCVLKSVLRKHGNQNQTCYYLPKQNVTVSECAFKCLQIKGENLENAQRCQCANGVCLPETTTTTTEDGTTEFTDETTTFSSPTSASTVSSLVTTASTTPTAISSASTSTSTTTTTTTTTQTPP